MRTNSAVRIDDYQHVAVVAAAAVVLLLSVAARTQPPARSSNSSSSLPLQSRIKIVEGILLNSLPSLIYMIIIKIAVLISLSI